MRDDLVNAGHSAVIKPRPTARNPHLGPDQSTRDDFTIDYTAGSVTCPTGFTVTISPKGYASFGSRCRDYAVRSRCTADADGKTFTVSNHDHHLAAARAQWRDGTDTDGYRQYRPLV